MLLKIVADGGQATAGQLDDLIRSTTDRFNAAHGYALGRASRSAYIYIEREIATRVDLSRQ